MKKPGADIPGASFHVALGRRLKFLRERIEFTQKEIGERIGASPSAVDAYESGGRRVPVALLPAFARVLGVSLDVLLGYKPPPRLRATHVSPAQRRHVELLHKLTMRDRLAIMRITSALAEFDR
jgi:transcriptional regulator with XRE-family HTH domain